MTLNSGWFGRAALVLVAVASPAMAADPLVLGPFVGTTPCADCPGIATELTLTRKDPDTAEGGYRLRMTYLERGPPLETAGDWTTLRGTPQDPNATVYELNPDEPGKEQYWLKVGDERVTLLGRDLNPIQSDLNFTLASQPAGLANPASVHCVQKGGVSRLVQDPNGWHGMCHFPDGRACDEWEFVRQGVCSR